MTTPHARPKDAFFAKMAELRIALTYDDVRLKTDHSSISPADADLRTRFSRHIELSMPVVSAAMDTVTGAGMAIALARLGGIGVLSRHGSPEEQAGEVDRVKFHLHGLIEKPICVGAEETIEQVLARKEEKGFPFDTFPVVDARQVLVGILSRHDVDLCSDHTRTVNDVMSAKPVTAPEGTSVEEARVLMERHKVKVLPVVDAERRVAGLYVFSDVERITSGRLESATIDDHKHLRVAAAIGVGEEALVRAALLVEHRVDALVIDTAHGDSKPVFETLTACKRRFPDTDVIVGNISNGDSAVRLAEAGADAIKVGQGPGSICTTRVVAGIGTPQVTAVYESTHALEVAGHDVPVIADGGIRFSGDIPIAIAAGAHTVMLGSLLAGCDESPGELVLHQGRQFKSYRGMGSLEAMKTSSASRQRYQQARDAEAGKLVPEGIEGLVPYRGALAAVLHQYIGGLRAGMGYVGAETIEALRERADFIRSTAAGQKESHPHDLAAIQDAPNYSPER